MALSLTAVVEIKRMLVVEVERAIRKLAKYLTQRTQAKYWDLYKLNVDCEGGSRKIVANAQNRTA